VEPTREVDSARGGLIRREAPLRMGDLRWNGEEWRRWNGRRWIRALASVQPERLRNPARYSDEDAVSDERQQRALALAVEDQVATYGAHVVFQGPSGAIIGYRRRVSHGLHAILTILTSGLWAIVWLAAAAGRREDRVRLEPDRFGNIWVTKVAGA
jgi:hypothetical protein